YMLAQVHLEQGDERKALEALKKITAPSAGLDEVRSAMAAAHERSTHAQSFLHSFAEHTDWVSSVSVSLDGLQGLSGSADRTLKYWELPTGKCLRTLAGHADWVTAVCLSDDGQVGLSGSADKTLKVWDMATGDRLQT